MKQVLLVGNGPSILDKPLGGAIDAFDGEVVRFNEFVLDPVEYTGVRTDTWIIAHKSHPIEHMHPELFSKIVRVPKEIQYLNKDTRLRSTGVAAVFWFLTMGYEVVLHGFNHFDPEKRLHYFDHDRGCELVKNVKTHPHDRALVEEAVADGMPVRYFDE
jgi:hypothetical protein